MDKSESELLEGWDLVSVHDTEQENISQEKSNTTDEQENKCEQNSEASRKEITDSNSVTPVADHGLKVVAVTVSDIIDSVTKEMADAHVAEQITGVMHEISEDIKPHFAANVTEESSSSWTNTGENSEETCRKAGEIKVEVKTEQNVVAKVPTADQQIETIDSDVGKMDVKKIERIRTEPIQDYNEDQIVNSSLDSSMEHIQIELCEGSSLQDVPETVPDLMDEQENAAIESSSSDIDIIDENMEESATSSFLHPLSLSISSSVDTSSILTTTSENKKEKKAGNTEDIMSSQISDSYAENSPSPESSAEKSDFLSEISSTFKKSAYEDKREREHVQPNPQRPHHRNSVANIFAGILAFLRNMTSIEWSILGGVVLCLYVTIVFNQTNIFAVVEKENVVSQMKKMIDELKHDNKILKDQMLSEMKNEKVFSSFNYQIKELKKENSKLNHMLYDVAKVLEEQKVTQKRFEKRQADYITPYKKEIDSLKEYINLLKYDNEDLQKQLVRMRYSSFSQGRKDTTEDKAKEQKDEIKADETGSTEEIPLDINALKKWNELISLLSKELGLSDSEPLKGDKTHTEKKNISWYWKAFFKEFKGTFKDFKANVTSVISDYNKANKEAVSKVYKFVKDFFTVEEEKNQKFPLPGEDNPQWKNIGDFVNDLKEKWTHIKDRIYTSDLKSVFEKFKNSGKTDAFYNNYNSENTKSTQYNEQEHVNTHFESSRRRDNMESNSEDPKWMFKRAELRAELRDAEKEDPSVNWFLKKKKLTSEDDEKTVKY